MAIFNCALTMFSMRERLLAIASTLFTVAFVVLRQDTSHSLEYPALALGLATFIALMVGQVRKRKAETAAGADEEFLPHESASLLDGHRGFSAGE